MSSLVVFTIPTKKRHKLASALLAKRPTATQHDYEGGLLTGQGHVTHVNIVSGGVEVAIWISEPSQFRDCPVQEIR